LLEPLQRLAYRGPADAQAFGQVFLANALAVGESALPDRIAQTLIDKVRPRSGAKRLGFRHGRETSDHGQNGTTPCAAVQAASNRPGQYTANPPRGRPRQTPAEAATSGSISMSWSLTAPINSVTFLMPRSSHQAARSSMMVISAVGLRKPA